MEDKQFITILGLGNILMKDEGFGVHFVRWIESRWRLPETVELIEGGVMELNRSSEDDFAEVEQAAFNPANVVPGIGFSPAQMLQGRPVSSGDWLPSAGRRRGPSRMTSGCCARSETRGKKGKPR